MPDDRPQANITNFALVLGVILEDLPLDFTARLNQYAQDQ